MERGESGDFFRERRKILKEGKVRGIGESIVFVVKSFLGDLDGIWGLLLFFIIEKIVLGGSFL